MAGLIERMLGAAKLDVATYEAVEADTSATPQALGVVAIVAIATGIGSYAYGGFGSLIFGLIAAVVGWAIWAALVWLIGTKLLPEPQTQSDWGEIARTTAFAQSPGVLRIFGFVPGIGGLLVFAVSIWMLVAMVIAIRQALDYTQTWRAVVVVLIGWLVNVLIFALLAGLGGNGA